MRPVVLMAILFSTTQADATVDLVSGTGHVQVGHSGCVLRGKGPGRTVIKPDGTYSSAFQATASVGALTMRDLTIDCDYRSDVLGSISSGFGKVVMHNVEVINMQRAGIAVVNGGELDAHGLLIYGGGGGVQSTPESTSTILSSVTVRGGRFGFVNTAGAPGITPGIAINGMDIDHGYFASPVYEAVTVTAFDATSAYVESNVTAARDLYDCIRVLTPVLTFDTERTLRSPLAQQYDRAETADGRWAEVLGFLSDGTPHLSDWHAAGRWQRISTPSAQATLYRVTLGRMFGWTSTRLMLRTNEGYPATGRWRTAVGTAASTPSMVGGVRVDVVRHGSQAGQTRDVDSGGIHVTASALNSVVRGVSARRGFSDQISTRAVGGMVENCFVDLGQDMGFTIDASFSPQIVRRCQATRIGNHGYYLGQFNDQPTPSRIESCVASGNGTHGYGYGFAADTGAEGTFITARGTGNALGLAGNCTVSPGGFERPQRPSRSRRGRRRLL